MIGTESAAYPEPSRTEVAAPNMNKIVAKKMAMDGDIATQRRRFAGEHIGTRFGDLRRRNLYLEGRSGTRPQSDEAHGPPPATEAAGEDVASGTRTAALARELLQRPPDKI